MNILDIMNKLAALSQPIAEAKDEKTITHKGGVKTASDTGVKHQGKYGNEFQGDDEEEAKNKAKKPAGEKRGRGRPPKDAPAGGSKPDWSAFGAQKGVKLKPWDKKATVKHSLKDWIENLDTALNEADEVTIKPASQTNTQVIQQGNKTIGTVNNPQLAQQIKQSMGKGEMSLAGDDLAEEKNYMGETQYNTYFGWKVASRKAGAKSFTGDRDIDQGLDASGKAVSEWDGASGSVFDDAHKQKAEQEVDEGATGRGEWDSNASDYQGDYGGAKNWGRREREDDEGYSRTAKADKAWNASPERKAALAKAVASLKNKPVSESKMSEMDLDLKDKNFSDAAFKKQYGKTKAEMRASFAKKPEAKKPTSKIKESILRESSDTMTHIINKFKHEVKNFVAGADLDEDLYEALYDYYLDMGEMPYGVAKARSGDPYEWVTERFERDVQDHEVPIDEEVRPENIPAVQRKQAGRDFPATLDQVNRNDSLSHLPNLRAAQGKASNNPFGATPLQGSVQFENWDKQLDTLLNEGMNVVANTGLGDAEDSVTISATADDASALLSLVKSAGLGMFASAEPEQQSQAMSVQGDEQTPDDINVVDDADGMLSLIKKMSGDTTPAPVEDEQTHEVAEQDEQPGDDDQDDESTEDNTSAEADTSTEEEDEKDENKEEELDEAYANDADKTFDADIDFMQNVISGGLNGKKRTQSVGNPVTIADTQMKESTDLLTDWIKLAGNSR